MTVTTTMNELLAADEAAKRTDAWRKYRTRLKDAAGVEQLDAAQAGKLAELAAAAGVDESQIARHIGAVAAHQKHTARLKELETEIAAADTKRPALLADHKALVAKLDDVVLAIRATHRPAHEESRLVESVRRLETKHAQVLGTEVV